MYNWSILGHWDSETVGHDMESRALSFQVSLGFPWVTFFPRTEACHHLSAYLTLKDKNSQVYRFISFVNLIKMSQLIGGKMLVMLLMICL